MTNLKQFRLNVSRCAKRAWRSSFIISNQLLVCRIGKQVEQVWDSGTTSWFDHLILSTFTTDTYRNLFGEFAFVFLPLQLEGWGYNPALREALSKQYFGNIRGKRTVRERLKHAGDASRRIEKQRPLNLKLYAELLFVVFCFCSREAGLQTRTYWKRYKMNTWETSEEKENRYMLSTCWAFFFQNRVLICNLCKNMIQQKQIMHSGIRLALN